MNETSDQPDHLNWTLNDENQYNEVEWYNINIKIITPILCLVCYSVTFIVGIIGNSLVIWIAGFNMESIYAVWFLNLAITDFICNIALLLRITEWTLHILNNWPLGYMFCKISTPMTFFNMLTSVYFLTVISMDRCVSIMWPIWAKLQRTSRLARIISVIIWIVCLIITIPHITFYNAIDDMSDCLPKYSDEIPEESKHSVYAILTTKLLSLFLIPCCIILTCYGLIYYKLALLKKPGRYQQSLKVITAVVISFFVCWCPYSIWPFIILNSKYWDIDFLLSQIFSCLAYFNSCINPILYVFYCKDFKNTLRKSIPTMMYCATDHSDRELNSRSCT
ncbi:formyl peptide receptor-related sequence 3-like [Pelobates fuscus]|uniref:formyl peptide receptor-related sequence 3-like n=1 Tax=Pelobates fuscus TaxID=191477 RepID=UPI002FE4D68C